MRARTSATLTPRSPATRSRGGSDCWALTHFFSPAPTSTDKKSSARRRPRERLPNNTPTKFRPQFRKLWKRMGISNDDFIRTTEERHMKRRAGTIPSHSRQRLHLQRHLHRPILRLRRTLRRWRAARRSLPDVRAHHGNGSRRKLFLQALGVSGQAAGALYESRLHPPRDAAQRSRLRSCAPGCAICRSAARHFPGAFRCPTIPSM